MIIAYEISTHNTKSHRGFTLNTSRDASKWNDLTDLIRAYAMPDKYAVDLPIEQVISDEKVDEGYVRELAEGPEGDTKPIVVIKHPEEDIYAVLDGHHRLAVARLRGVKTIKAAIVDDYVGLGFELTRRGIFQPTPEFTRYIRVPIKRFVNFIECFLKDPESYLNR